MARAIATAFSLGARQVAVEHVRFEQDFRPPQRIKPAAGGLHIHEGVELVLADADALADARQIDVVEPLRTALEAVEVGHFGEPLDMKKAAG